MAGIKESFSRSITTINVKTSGFVEENKIKSYISTLENSIDAAKRQLGRMLYEQWKESSEADVSQLEDIMQQIQANEKEIENQKGKLDQLHMEQQQILGASSIPQISGGSGDFCPQCGTKNLPDNKFCCACGARLAH